MKILMVKNFFGLFVILSFSLFLSCDNKPNANANKAANVEVKTGVKPVADPEIAVIEMQEPAFGTMKIELYSNIAPKMVERFKTLAKEGFYNGTTFHRVSGIVIQGGDPNSKDAAPENDGMGSSGQPNLPAEFSDIPYERGTVGAARAQDENSANCQFYITLKRQPAFDNRYTVFGRVIEGIGNADVIAGAPIAPGTQDRPAERITVRSVTLAPRSNFK
jgi:peptidyl-prolyl cis-trans isomerase B (cyclophilin B)